MNMRAIGLRLVAVWVAALMSGVAWADVVVRVEIVEGKPEAAEAKKVPAGETTLTVETLADAGGNFRTRTRVGKRTIELKGTVKQSDGDRRRIQVDFSDSEDGLGQQVTTTLLMKTNEPRVVSKLEGDSSQRAILLTIVDDDE
jgi:hypothetical protein